MLAVLLLGLTMAVRNLYKNVYFGVKVMILDKALMCLAQGRVYWLGKSKVYVL